MTRAYPADSDLARIAAGISERWLPKSEWTHAAHFGAALWLLRHRQGFDAPRDMPAIIRAYNDATGTPNTTDSGYHATITLASLKLAGAALAAAPTTPLHLVLDNLLAGPCGRSDWLLAHWSAPLLFSPAARQAWCPPDLLPLPE